MPAAAAVAAVLPAPRKQVMPCWRAVLAGERALRATAGGAARAVGTATRPPRIARAGQGGSSSSGGLLEMSKEVPGGRRPMQAWERWYWGLGVTGVGAFLYWRLKKPAKTQEEIEVRACVCVCLGGGGD
jgi:hypothetical protein